MKRRLLEVTTAFALFASACATSPSEPTGLQADCLGILKNDLAIVDEYLEDAQIYANAENRASLCFRNLEAMSEKLDALYRKCGRERFTPEHKPVDVIIARAKEPHMKKWAPPSRISFAEARNLLVATAKTAMVKKCHDWSVADAAFEERYVPGKSRIPPSAPRASN